MTRNPWDDSALHPNHPCFAGDGESIPLPPIDHAAYRADREARDAAALERIERTFAELKAANARLREAALSGRGDRIGEAA